VTQKAQKTPNTKQHARRKTKSNPPNCNNNNKKEISICHTQTSEIKKKS
jgi:hypothetical protein